MNKNNVNVNIENEEVKIPIYNSRFLMSKELFYDFCSVNYNKTKKIFLIFFCLVAHQIVLFFIDGNYDMIIGFGSIMSFMMLLIYLRTKRAIKIGYKQHLITAGKENTLNYELFEYKIVSNINGCKKEYF